MNKAELAQILCTTNGLSKVEAAKIVNLFFDQMAAALEKGDRVEIRGLCSFYVKKYGRLCLCAADLKKTRAILGMLGVDGREVMRRRFRDDTLTLFLPVPLFQRMEQEADDCVFQIPS